MWSAFLFQFFTGGYGSNISLSLRRDFRLLNSAEIVKDYGDFWSWTEFILNYGMATGLWG